MGGYAVHPGKELTVALKLMNVVKDLDKSILQNIVCVIVIFYNIPDLPVKSLFVEANKVPKSRISTILILKVT